MPVLGSDLKLYKSANHPADDTSVAGGAQSATEIVNASVGEWLPRLAASASGTVDVDVQKQYQKAFFENTSSNSLLDSRIYLTNGLVVPGSAGVFSVASSSASDDNTKKVRVWGVMNGVLDSEEIVLNGTTEVNGVKTFTKVFRVKLMLVSSSAVTPAAGTLTLEVNGAAIGVIPIGYSWATQEVKIGLVSTTDDSGTTANRRTAPSGISFSQPNTLATGIPIRNDAGNDTLGPGVAQGIWAEMTLQPGMDPFNGVELGITLDGDSD